MVPNAESLGGPSTALGDPRLTRIGATLRKYKLDELPQLLNVLKGEMSLVGPRPQVQAYTDLYSAEEKRILDVRPGLTDFASIEFIHLDSMLGSEDVDEKYAREIEPRKNELRLKYVREQSLATDLLILFRTITRLATIRKLWNSGH
jgi:lipopolysaccharide/colanic/teichoic acid biosynthesis glycosyltransferase